MITAETLHDIAALREQRDAISKKLSTLEGEVKAELEAAGLTEFRNGEYVAKLRVTPPGWIVDTAALKEHGLFEKFSKPKAGYTALSVKRLA